MGRDDSLVVGIAVSDGFHDKGQRAGADLDARAVRIGGSGGSGGGGRLDDRGVADEEVGVVEHSRGGVGQDELAARHFGRGSGEALAVGGDGDAAVLGGEEDAVEDCGGWRR